VALRQEFTGLSDDVDLDRDRALVERCQAGDQGAFGTLYARYYERLQRFCLRRLHDRHEAEDAAQEAFARAWKALPNFAGERRFYPWLTVIAGNVCTDTLRRRSRATPTADTELSGRLPVGAAVGATADEVIIASVDGELVHRALDRLSDRHRHVLDMREGSGWTYQQMADHEGVEIGTIETLLWRARQALKREFNVLAEAKGALAGFLVGAGALIRTGVARAAHRGAGLVATGGSGSVRNALAGVAVTSAAVAGAFIAPHALEGAHAGRVALPAPTGAAATGVLLPRAAVTPAAGSTSGGSGAASAGAGAAGASAAGSTTGGSSAGVSSNGAGIAPVTTGATAGLPAAGGVSLPTLSGENNPVNPQQLLAPVGAVAGAVAGEVAHAPTAVTSTLGGTVSTAFSGVGTALGGVGAAVSALPSLGASNSAGSTGSTTSLPPNPLSTPLSSTAQKILGG
jgi:RNA polymerase sigma factor (sigma-70 family)